MIDFIKTNLRGMGQVMLQNSALTGLLFLVGIFYNSWIMGVGALIGLIFSTVFAFLLKYNKEDISNGLYGFNGALVGLALTYFFNFNFVLIVLIILFSIFTTYIMHVMHSRKLSPFTFSFVFSSWIAIFFINYLNLVEKNIHETISSLNLNIFSSFSMSFGQVMFQISIIAGILFFIGILFNSRLSALYGFIGFIAGMFVGLLISDQIDLINMGVFGFNAVLCGVAFSNEKKYAFIFVLFSSIISVFIMNEFLYFNLIALTMPFVLATWVTMFLKNKIVYNEKIV
ncbi:MAG: urea transporter [Candidatus Parcubacteria bacterium]|nr:urea transporter [Candidatus Parcubacteria bacterium]